MSEPNCTRVPPRRRPSRLSQIQPNRRPQALSPRAYQTRLDLCHLWDLMSQGKRPSEIAQMMGKDPAWVSRSIKKVQLDFSTVFQKPDERRVIQEQLAKLDALYSRAVSAAESSDGMKQLLAIRTATTILRERFNFMQFTGIIQKDSEAPQSPRQSTGLRFDFSTGQRRAVFD